MKGFVVRFEPEGKKLKADSESTILDLAKEGGVGIRSECGGKGKCGKCRIIVEEQHNLNEVTETERKHLTPQEIGRGYRLACMTTIRGNSLVLIPSESRISVRRIQVQGMEQQVKLDPNVRKINLVLEKPTLQNPIADDLNILTHLEKVYGLRDLEWEYELVKNLPDIIRDGNWNITVTLLDDHKIIDLESGDTTPRNFGFAVDIGTSKIVGYLVNLNSGEVVGFGSLENPQIAFGEDILSRISYAEESPEKRRRLQILAIEGINKIVQAACEEAGIKSSEIYELTVVGNTAMFSLFLGIQTKYLHLAPYVPGVKGPVVVKARELGVNSNPRASIYVLPNIAGYVGADAVGDVLATNIHEMDEMCLLVDVGTNGEVFVGNKDDIVSCSCAAGPAFEGVHIQHGMKAVSGAIERIGIDPKTFEVKYTTIDEAKPVGICGSGIIDAVAEMFKCGIISERGKFNDVQTARMIRVEGKPEFVIAWKEETAIGKNITVSLKDIEEVQLAKAAIHTGCAILMEKKAVTEDDIDRVFIAGAFGNYIDPESAKFLGLIPDIPTEKITFAGNTALAGAKMALLSREVRKTAQRLSRWIRYVELMAEPNFQREFVKSTLIPYRHLERYPSVKKYLEEKHR
ncbi:MAG: ASKHA domain-containing protein [Candidatus Jordarchaeaceae archaeon]